MLSARIQTAPPEKGQRFPDPASNILCLAPGHDNSCHVKGIPRFGISVKLIH